MKLSVLKADGEKTGSTVDFPDKIFAAPVNDNLLWEVVEAYRASQRRGTAKTKTRAEVQGSGRKMFRQKHLGRARMGSAYSPTRIHGGVAHGPRPRSYRKGVPLAMRRGALLEALKQKLQTGKVTVIEDIRLTEPKTKFVAKTIDKLREDNSQTLLLVTTGHFPDLLRASRNIACLELAPQDDLNAYSVWRPQKLVLFKSACKPLIERWR